MKRRSFITALAWLPIVGTGPKVFGQQKPMAKSGITVHGPELLAVAAFHARPIRTLSLRFENVPFGGEWNNGMGVHVSGMNSRLRPLGGVVNRSDWYWHGDIELAGSLMFTDWGISQQESGSCSLVCGFTPASDRPPWPGSHRPVDFETEILEAIMAV